MMGKAGGFTSCRARRWRRHASDVCRSFPPRSGSPAVHYRLLLLLLFLSLSVTHCVCQSSLSPFHLPIHEAQYPLLGNPDANPDSRGGHLSMASGSETASDYTGKRSPDCTDGIAGMGGAETLQEKLKDETGVENWRKRSLPDGARDMAKVATPVGGRTKGGCEMAGENGSAPTDAEWRPVMWTTDQTRFMLGLTDGSANNTLASQPPPQPAERRCRVRLGARDSEGGYLPLQAGIGTEMPELKPSPKIIIASFLSIIGAAFANVGGVGGGGLFVPMFNLLLGFDAKTSVPLSKAMILGGSIVSFLYNKRVRHPLHKDRSVIDYNVALLLQPMLLLGISTGVLCNVIFPSWLVVLLLTILLTYLFIRTFHNGIKKWRNETREFEKSKQRKFGAKEHDSGARTSDVEAGVDQGTMDARSGKNIQDAAVTTHEANTPEENANAHYRLLPHSAAEVQVEDVFIVLPKIKFPWKNIGILAAVWIMFLTIQILKSGLICVSNDYLVTPCGKGYWAITASQIPLALGLTLLAVRMLSGQRQPLESAKHLLAVDRNQSSREAHAVLGQREFFVLPCFACVAGIVGGLLGVGGGMVISPMLLELGYPPKVTTSTSMFMVLFASSMSVAEYALLGRIPLDFGVYFSILCAIAAWIGNAVLSKVINRWGRVSVIVFTTGAVMCCSAMIMGIFGSLEVIGMYEHGEYMGFNDICKA